MNDKLKEKDCNHEDEPIITHGLKNGIETTYMQCPKCYQILDYYPQY